MPYFTIVIPTFDRAHVLERALRTCLEQDFGDWEAVVVDDASPSASAAAAADVVRRIGDPRIRLVGHEQNRGVCEARNTGVRAARGLWIIFHDDDDELAPGGLTAIHDSAERAPTDVRRLIFAYRDDDGRTSPEPALTDGAVWEYREYLEWVERASVQTDFLNCIHRDVFDTVHWPSDRSREDLFHFELARRFRTECHSNAVAIIHRDASHRFSAVPGYARVLQMAPHLAHETGALLSQHGEALQQWAPRTFVRFLRFAAMNHYLAGSRKRGLQYSAAFLRRRPLASTGWAILFLGLLDRRALAIAVALGKAAAARARVFAPSTRAAA